ncbi:hypothetical protein Brms1b_009140 [Colletotrichum noveboracense]|nr:hypothetical protein Brms1b_009140 [Colletotrichum noveboracense]
MAHGASPVATRESYIGYKKDTQDLVEWMIKTTSLILKTQPRSGENAQLPTGMEANETTSKRPDSDAEQIEEMKGMIFSNKFASLDLSHVDSKPEPPSEPESDADEPVAESKTAKKKRVNGKKGKG